MSSITIAILVAANLGLLFLLLAAPLGIRTVTLRKRIAAPPAKIWSALFPLGENAGWSGEIVGSSPLPEGFVRLELSWNGRDDRPISRTIHLEGVVEAEHFSLHVEDDSALDASFWANYREEVCLVEELGGTLVTLRRTDRYRGAAFLIFRYFVMRRELAKLKIWAMTGVYRKGGLFERPTTQIGFAIVSALILWPLFGLNPGGLTMAAVLTTAVALHELGHMAAFRLMGHKQVRMIFIPLLGGIAIGGRPYDSRFEVAFVALMGAGFSAFLVPIAIAASVAARASQHYLLAAILAALVGCVALFNFANLVPVWKFDGGQVLRQICGGPKMLAAASFALLSGFLAFAYLAGVSVGILFAAGIVFAVLSLATGSHSVKPRHALKPIDIYERLAIGAALIAVFVIHGFGMLWASARIL